MSSDNPDTRWLKTDAVWGLFGTRMRSGIRTTTDRNRRCRDRAGRAAIWAQTTRSRRPVCAETVHGSSEADRNTTRDSFADDDHTQAKPTPN